MRAMVPGWGGLWLALLLLAGTAHAKVEIDFVPVSAEHESAAQVYFSEGLLDHPHYTRPETAGDDRVPAVLLGGDHEAIRRWRLKQALGRTWQRRPELLERRPLTEEEQALLHEFIDEAQGGSRNQRD
jgi:tRNA (guanine-N1)-methyltransferase